MFNHQQALVKKEGKWSFVSINKWKVKEKVCEDSDFDQIKKSGRFTSLTDYLKKNPTKLSLTEILKKLEVDDIRLLASRPFEPTEGEWEAYWFRDVHTQCEKCPSTCKQSSRITQLICDGPVVDKPKKSRKSKKE